MGFHSNAEQIENYTPLYVNLLETYLSKFHSPEKNYAATGLNKFVVLSDKREENFSKYLYAV